MQDQPEKLNKAQVSSLYQERLAIEAWLYPDTPEETPEQAAERKTREEWEKQALARLATIDGQLAPWFFPHPKGEGTERKEKHGFAAGLVQKIDRKFDLAALPKVIAQCHALAVADGIEFTDDNGQPCSFEERFVRWTPSLDLAAYRDMSPKFRAIFDAALVATPKAATFEIVKIED